MYIYIYTHTYIVCVCVCVYAYCSYFFYLGKLQVHVDRTETLSTALYLIKCPIYIFANSF